MEQLCTSTKWVCVLLDDKSKKSDLNKLMEYQCQHLTERHPNKLLKP